MVASRAERRRVPRPVMAYLAVLGAGILWGTSGPFSVTLFRMGLPPESVALLRTVVGGIFLALFLLWMNPAGFRISRRNLVAMMGLGGVIVGVFQFSFQMSTEAIGVPATVALLYLAPAFVVAVSPWILAERITWVRAGLAAVSVVGVWMTVFGSRGVDVEITPEGLFWGVMCGVTYGSYAMFGRILSPRHGPLAPLFWSTLGGAILLGVALRGIGAQLILPSTTEAWVILVIFGFTTITLAALLLFYAVEVVDAGRAAIGTTIEPFVATILAVAFLEQTLDGTGWLGLIVLVAGVAGAYRAGGPAPPEGGRGG